MGTSREQSQAWYQEMKKDPDKWAARKLRQKLYQRRLRAERFFGITIDEYNLYLRQPCAICGGESKHLDHDHKTGGIRAGLCSNCNSGIGLLQEDPTILRRAIRYLDFWNEEAAN